jgi:hypothetical protein
MIAVSKRFLGKSDEVRSKNLWCMVSTAKEGLFKRESTMIFRVLDSGNRRKNYDPLVKIIYAISVSKQDRLAAHDEIVSLANHSPTMRAFRSVFSEGNEARERN